MAALGTAMPEAKQPNLSTMTPPASPPTLSTPQQEAKAKGTDRSNSRISFAKED
jgi:hypothetical protein